MESNDAPVHEGGCLCGAVRYRVTGDPVQVVICHCVNCQRNSGSAFSVNAIFAAGTMSVEGPTAIYDDVGDSGSVVRRVFCPVCGTPIESQSAYSAPNYVVVKAGTFDHPDRFVPDSEVYCLRELPWVKGGKARVRHDGTISNPVGNGQVNKPD
jgi:hypothetical protein